jgi:hypothetical protein
MLVVAVPPDQPSSSHQAASTATGAGDGSDIMERSERILFSASKIKVRTSFIEISTLITSDSEWRSEMQLCV